MADPTGKSRVTITKEAGSFPPMGQITPPVRRLKHHVDRLFDDLDKLSLFSPFGQSVGESDVSVAAASEPGPAPVIVVYIVETQGGYEVIAELPGIGLADVKVGVAGAALTIRAEKPSRGYPSSLGRFEAFERRFELPDDVDPEAIEAVFAEGALTVFLPKAEPSRAIVIRGAA